MDKFIEYIIAPFMESCEEELTRDNALDLFRKYISSSKEITPEPKVNKPKRVIKTKNRYFKSREEYDEACRNGEKLCSHLYTKKNSLHQNTICGAPAQNAEETDDPDLWKCSSCKKRHTSIKEPKVVKEVVATSVVKPGFNISIPKNSLSKDKIKSENRTNMEPDHRYCTNRGLLGYILDCSGEKIICMGKIDDTEEELPTNYLNTLQKLNVTEIANIKNYGMEYKYRAPEIEEVTLSSSDDSDESSDEDEDKIVHSARREKIIDVTK